MNVSCSNRGEAETQETRTVRSPYRDSEHNGRPIVRSGLSGPYGHDEYHALHFIDLDKFKVMNIT